MPLLSVVLSVKNGARFLRSSLHSAFAQTYRPFEVIVVDGQSTDGSRDIVLEFSQARWVAQRDTGLPAANNLGIREARGEFIAFLEHDDLWDPQKTDKQVRRLAQDPRLQFSVTYFRYFLEPGHRLPSCFNPALLERDLPGRILSTLVVRRSFFKTHGLFDTKYQCGADNDWFARAKDAKAGYDLLPEALVFKRIHDRNLTHTSPVSNRELLQVMRKSIHRMKGLSQ